jgi:hypothetical protein
MGLVEHAERELRIAGLFDEDSDYGGMLGEAVLDLVRKFAEQGHSGFSALQTLAIFERVARWKPLSGLTSDPSEWMVIVDRDADGLPVHQSRRQPSCFSRDGGRTYYDIDEDGRPIHVSVEPA